MVTRQVRRPRAQDVEAAWQVVRARLGPTPVDAVAGPGLLVKLESLQPTGSFKVRGALNALATLDPAAQVVAASAGNHGLGVAFAAALLGRKVTVVVPGNASPSKVAALRRFPVTLVEAGSSYDDAEAHALRLAEHSGCRYLSPYNDPHVIAGQGTIGCELDDQLPGPLTVVCPVGGGGLAAGLGLWASQRDGVVVAGVEAEVSRAVSAAVRAGGQVDVAVGDTIADGVSGNIEPGCVTVDVIRDHVESLTTVTEQEIRSAIRYLAASHGIVAEGAGAMAVAAVLAGKVPADRPVAALVTGRNITPATLAGVLAPEGA
jgi:threonine dehydratase